MWWTDAHHRNRLRTRQAAVYQRARPGDAELFPLSEVGFFLRIVDAIVRFARAPDGTVTGRTLLERGRSPLEAERIREP